MITDLFDKNIVKILSLFFISPGSKHTRKEIKEKTGMNNIPLDIGLRKLLKQKITKKTKNLYELSPSLPPEIETLVESLKTEFREKFVSLPLKVFYTLTEISEKLSRIKEIKNVFLFGSYAKLIYTEKSDIDLAIILPDRLKNKTKLIKQINKTTNRIEKKFKREIETHFFSESNLKHKKDPLIKDIIKNSRQII